MWEDSTAVFDLFIFHIKIHDPPDHHARETEQRKWLFRNKELAVWLVQNDVCVLFMYRGVLVTGVGGRLSEQTLHT